MIKLKVLLLLFLGGNLVGQDTFSLCAVDSTTGQVGSVGASCLDNIQFPGSNGAILISDIKPGVGVIHTQSYWLAGNQANARARMELGETAPEVIDWLVQNDQEGNAAVRQYGAAIFDIDGRPTAKAFTGANCFDYKGQEEGLSYTVQGNILLGQQILDSMQARFLREKGDLAAKLMAALQGANVAGADKRCLNEGVSSLSAFLRVAKPDDEEGNLYLDLNVPSTPFGVEPIDSLQSLYDQWRILSSLDNEVSIEFKLSPNPFTDKVTLSIDRFASLKDPIIIVTDMTGKIVLEAEIEKPRTEMSLSNFPQGIFTFSVKEKGSTRIKIVKLIKR